MLEDRADAVRIVNGGEQCAPGQTVGAGQHIDEVDAAQELSPGVALARATVLGWSVRNGRLAAARVVVERLVRRRVGGVGRTRRLRAVAFALAIVVAATIVIIGERRRWDDAVAHAGSRSQHAVIREQHAARPRHQRAQPFEKRERVEDDVGGAVAVALLQAVADATIGQQ